MAFQPTMDSPPMMSAQMGAPMMVPPFMPSYGAPMMGGMSPPPVFPAGGSPPGSNYYGMPIGTASGPPSGGSKSSAPPPPKPKSTNPEAWTQNGQRANLHTIGAPLDSNQQVRDAQTGETMAGVGIFFQQEQGDWIYVANVVANSSAERSGLVRANDELIRVDDYEVTLDSSLEQIRTKILGRPGDYVLLSFRRPGGQNGMGGRGEYFYFDAELMRGNAEFIQKQQPVERPPPQRTAPREQTAAVRAAPPPPQEQVRAAAPPPPSEDMSQYEEEIRRLRGELDNLRNHQNNQDDQEDPRVAPLEEELKARMEDLRRFEQMLVKAQDKAKEAERQKNEAMQHVANLQQENLQLQSQGSQNAQTLEQVSARQQGDIQMLQSANGQLKRELDEERNRAQQSARQAQDQIAKLTEELSRARREHDEKRGNEGALRGRLAQGHAAMAEALRTQESQMAVLADIVPSLDMVHSSLLSSIALDPVRLQSFQLAQPPPTQLTSLGPDMGRSLSMSINSASAGPAHLLSASASNLNLAPYAHAQGPPRGLAYPAQSYLSGQPMSGGSQGYQPLQQPMSGGSQLELA